MESIDPQSTSSSPFYSVEEEVQSKPIVYPLAFTDSAFLLRPENRSIRLQLEYLKAEMVQLEQNIQSTIVFFGSARIESEEKTQRLLKEAEHELSLHPNDPIYIQKVKKAKHAKEKSFYYEQARKLAHIISIHCQGQGERHLVVITGGGPGIMEAANRGAHDAKCISIGLNILLPKEERPNPFISPELNFQFHYFAMRKMHLLVRARAAIFFPGGYGTLDELFETLTLLQTEKIAPIPILLFSKAYWSKIVNFDALIEEGAIDQRDRTFFQFVESAEEAWEAISSFYKDIEDLKHLFSQKL